MCKVTRLGLLWNNWRSVSWSFFWRRYQNTWGRGTKAIDFRYFTDLLVQQKVAYTENCFAVEVTAVGNRDGKARAKISTTDGVGPILVGLVDPIGSTWTAVVGQVKLMEFRNQMFLYIEQHQPLTANLLQSQRNHLIRMEVSWIQDIDSIKSYPIPSRHNRAILGKRSPSWRETLSKETFNVYY